MPNETPNPKKIKGIHLFANGNIVVFDGDGNCINELCINPIKKVMIQAHEIGFGVPDDVEIHLPEGKKADKTKGEISYIWRE